MNSRRIIAAVVLALALVSSASSGEPSCTTLVVRSEVEIAGAELALGDLLEPGSCSAVLAAARQVRLGAAPLPGSARVLPGNEVRALFEKLLAVESTGFWSVPERITVRRAGRRSSCADLTERILATLPAQPSGAPGRTIDCVAAGRIPQDAPLELSKAVWDAGLAGWEISARCLHPADCVPFLVRVREGGSRARSARPASLSSISAAGASSSRANGVSPGATDAALVRPGQTATLVWEQDGIRLLVPVICLDPGALGRTVRVRIVPRGQVIRAIVVSAGNLRAAS